MRSPPAESAIQQAAALANVAITTPAKAPSTLRVHTAPASMQTV